MSGYYDPKRCRAALATALHKVARSARWTLEGQPKWLSTDRLSVAIAGGELGSRLDPLLKESRVMNASDLDDGFSTLAMNSTSPEAAVEKRSFLDDQSGR